MNYEPNQIDAEVWKENIKYLLDHCPLSVRVRYKGGEENLLESLCVTFMKLQMELKK